MSGSLYLKSNGGLHLDDNAVLKGHPDISKWPIRPVCVERSPFAQEGKVEAHLICCVNQSNVTVEGGIIDGNGAAFLGTGDFRKAGGRSFLRKADQYPGQLLWFNACDSVFLYITLDYLFSRKVTYSGVLENVKLTNVKGVSSLPLVFNGNETGTLRDIAISDCDFRIRDFSDVPDSEREYFFVSTNREDDRNLVQSNHVENLTFDNVRITQEAGSAH